MSLQMYVKAVKKAVLYKRREYRVQAPTIEESNPMDPHCESAGHLTNNYLVDEPREMFTAAGLMQLSRLQG